MFLKILTKWSFQAAEKKYVREIWNYCNTFDVIPLKLEETFQLSVISFLLKLD